jgi:8-oxo-dGTP pyrophosphatase MutT (NUDIX family)
MKKGPFVEIARSMIYRTKWLRVEEARVIRPDGTAGLFGLAHVVRGATVVALDDDRNIFLVKEYKYAVERETIEVISGGIDEGETPLEAAVRELHEETGHIANKVSEIGVVEPFTTIVSGRIHMILAQELVYRPREAATDDIVEPFRVPFGRALKMIEDGEITHAPSCVAILRAARMIDRTL